MSDLTYTAQTASLYPGDVLLSVTDGITERKDASGRLLDDDDGLAALLAHCRGLNAGAVAARIVRARRGLRRRPPHRRHGPPGPPRRVGRGHCLRRGYFWLRDG